MADFSFYIVFDCSTGDLEHFKKIEHSERLTYREIC